MLNFKIDYPIDFTWGTFKSDFVTICLVCALCHRESNLHMKLLLRKKSYQCRFAPYFKH